MGLEIKWSTAKRVMTGTGPAYVRSWVIPPNLYAGFFKFWEENKLGLKLDGYSVNKSPKDEWQFNEWRKRLTDFKDLGTSQPAKTVTIPEKSSLVLEPLRFTEGLREWQPPVVQQLVASIKKWGAAVDGSDTGTGKTYTAVAVGRELDFEIAVICPKAVITSWKRVIKNHFKMTPIFVMNYEAIKGGKHKHVATWDKVSKKSTREVFTWKIPNPKSTLIIFDESHRLKDGRTINSEMAVSAHKQGYNILCCSATNAINPIELKTVGRILGLHSGSTKGFAEFLQEHDCSKGRFGWEFGGDQMILKKLHFDIFKERGARLKKEEIPGFPECDLVAEAYDMDEQSKADINAVHFEMKKELDTINRTIKSESEKMANALVAQLRARQKTELIKVPLFVDMAEEALEDGMSVVIIVNFTETIKALEKRLNVHGQIPIIWGLDPKNRQKYIDQFNADEARIILVNIKAGGVGLSLHDLNGKYPRMAIISPGPSAVELRQATGRVWRAGALTKAMQRIVFVAGTVEEQICDQLKKKLDQLDQINDGDLMPNEFSVIQE
jgi:superfamily II DNA or RNA helicase